jgi:hypothetical protein
LLVPYQFTEYPPEPEPQPASSRGTRPPRKAIGVDLLDAPEALPAPPIDSRFRIRIPVWLGAVLLIASVIILVILSGRL